LLGNVCARAGAAMATTASKAISQHFMNIRLRLRVVRSDDGRNAA